MEAAIYRLMQQVEDEHWWFVGRRRIIDDVLRRRMSHGHDDARVLDVGCGTGGNLAMLSGFGSVYGAEPDPGAAAAARARGIGRVESAALPELPVFDGLRFDLITLTDVLEHLDEDSAALRALAPRLAPGGRVLITVPAFRFLWGAHDVAHHHRRRYTARSLAQCISAAGLQVEFLRYFNAWLFPAIAAWRLLGGRSRAQAAGTGLAVPPAPMNRMLETLFASERFVLRQAGFPFGVSILALARHGDHA